MGELFRLKNISTFDMTAFLDRTYNTETKENKHDKFMFLYRNKYKGLVNI